MRKFTQKVRRALFALGLCGALAGQSQIPQNLWQFSNPKPIGFNVVASSFFDNNNGLMVGDAIAKTNDGGVTWGYTAYWWINNGSVVKPTFNDVQMVTASLAFASGTGGTLIKSVDGGLNWTRVANPMEASGVEITSVSFVNASVGWIAGLPIGGETSSGTTTLYKTSDGGTTWTLEPKLPKWPAVRLGSGTVASPFYYDSTRAKSLYRIRMVSPTLGYCSGAAGLLWKYDGTGWKNYSATNFRMGLDTLANATRPVVGPQSQTYRGLVVVSDTLAVISSNSNGVIIQVNTAHDTARPRLRNWSGNLPLSPLGLTTGALWNIAKAPNGRLAMSNGSGGYLLSTDSGFNWQKSDVYPTGGTTGGEGLGIFSVSVTPNNRYVFGGAFGVVADSLNGTWRRPYINRRPGAGFNKIQFADANTGVAAGGFGAIVATVDGGANWVDRTNGNDAAAQISYYAMDFYKPDSFYLATSSGQVRMSVDQAQTFDLLFADSFKIASNSSSPIFYAMDWANSQYGWVASWRGHSPSSGQPNRSQSVIFYTRDGGLTWDSSKSLPAGPWPIINNVAQNYTPQVRDIKFVNERVGFAASSRSSIWKTTDGGVNWTRVYHGADSASFSGGFISISIVDSNNIYVAGNGGRAFRSTDGGATWINAKGNLPNSNLNGILAYDSLQAFVFMPSGQMWYTANGGGLWRLEQSPSPVGGSNGILTDGAFASINPGCGQPVCNTLWVTGSGGLIYRFGSDRVLPVKFSKLTGSATGRGNQLFWTAFAQRSVKHYEIQHATDGANFTTLSRGRVLPSGFEVEAHNWLHADAAPGANYYRVKALEMDGTITYTNIVKLDSRKPGAAWSWQVSNGQLLLRNAELAAGPLTIKVMNTAGQQIAAKAYANRPAGVFNDMLNLPMQLRGTYYVQIIQNNQPQSLTIFIE